jgi:hypothetical protein
MRFKMGDNEKSKLTMYETVITYLLENRDIISVNRSFSHTISRLRKAIDEIKVKDRELSSDTMEKTLLAYKIKDELIFTLIPITSALYSIARETGNIELKEKTRLSQSYFIRLRDTELVNISLAIHQLAVRNSYRLGKHNITKTMVHNLKDKTEKFRDALDNKIITFVSSNAALSLKSAFQDADDILTNQMDKLMEPLSDEYEEFYDDYLAIRSNEYFEEYEDEGLEIGVEDN